MCISFLRMFFLNKYSSFKNLISLLLLLVSCTNLVSGFFVKNCNIKGFLKYPGTVKTLCSKKQLTSVPENLPYGTSILDVSKNAISQIKKSDLLNLPYLIHLNASYNRISYIETGAFSSLTSLQDLNLAFNKLAVISEGFFDNLSNLTILQLNENNLKEIHPSAFLFLHNLKTVNLSGNHLLSVQQVRPIFMLLNIQEMHIGANGFTSFQTQEITNASTTLKTLDLSHNPLQAFTITSDIFPKLEMLDLAFVNQSMKWDVQDKQYLKNVNRLNLSAIAMTPEEIKTVLQTFNSTLENVRLYYLGQQKVKQLIGTACLIKSLATLRLESNKITSISEKELKYCTEVTVLDVAENSLSSVTELAFSSITKLNTLKLNINKLKSVPTAVRNMSMLEILDLSYNFIKKLTCSDFENLSNLSLLHIYRNNLYTIEHCTFQDLNNLKSLQLSSNQLLSLKGYFRKGLRRLETLQLAHNKLNTIHRDDFTGLQSLKLLDLNNNQITNIETGSFEGLSNLECLELQSNKITRASVTSRVFTGLSSLRVLKINNNDLSYASQESLVDPPFTHLSSLDVLRIFSQGQDGLLNLPMNFFKGLSSLTILHAGNLNIKSLHPLTLTHVPRLSILDLSKNELILPSPKIFLPVKNLSILYMVKTGLESIDFIAQANLTGIRFLQVRKNSVSVINESVISSLPKLYYLSVEGNEFSCDCSNAWFVDWAKSNNDTQVLNADLFTCNYPPNFRGNKLMHLDTASCTLDMGFYAFISTVLLVLLTLISSFLYHFFKWQVVYAYYLFLAFVYDKSQQKSKELQDFQYDAFISYNTHDELWVINELLPQLEGQQGWRLCLHHRDFQPGKPIIDNIVDGIYKSRKTICVISRHYLESEWCSREIQVASFRLFDEKKDVLVLVFLEDIPAHQLSPHYRMRSLIKKRTYLSWPKPGQDTQVFWQKLRVALQTRSIPQNSDI